MNIFLQFSKKNKILRVGKHLFFSIQILLLFMSCSREDIIKRPIITFGFFSFVFLIPLAITSQNKIIKRLGFKLWKRIHYLIYLTAILSSVHFYMLVRANKTEPLIYIIIIIFLLFYRLFKRFIVPRMAR